MTKIRRFILFFLRQKQKWEKKNNNKPMKKAFLKLFWFPVLIKLRYKKSIQLNNIKAKMKMKIKRPITINDYDKKNFRQKPLHLLFAEERRPKTLLMSQPYAAVIVCDSGDRAVTVPSQMWTMPSATSAFFAPQRFTRGWAANLLWLTAMFLNAFYKCRSANFALVVELTVKQRPH